MSVSSAYLDRIAEKLKNYSGLCLVGVHREILKHVVEDRLLRLGVGEQTYFNNLDNDFEMNTLVNSVRIGETYFFREEKQFDFLDSVVFPKLESQSIVWSSACSSGEEAISLAVLNRKYRSPAKIIASDINTLSIKKFSAGVYRPLSFRQDGSKYKKLLDEVSVVGQDGSIAFDKNFISSIYKADFNLILQKGSLKYNSDNSVSLILARNVLIYFDYKSQCDVVHYLAKKLCRGGILLLSSTEISFLKESDFAGLEKKVYNGVYYFEKTGFV